MQSFGSPTIRPLLGVWILASLVAGCASWTTRSDQETAPGRDESPLPEVAENPRAVVLEVQFIPISLQADQPDVVASLWQWADETAFDPDTRGEFKANGLRVGRLVREDRFRSKLDDLRVASGGVLERFLTEASVASELSQEGRRIPMRFGRRYELALSKPLQGQHVTLVRRDGETIGQTMGDPQFLFAITPTTGDSPRAVKLRLRPEIQHGAMKQSFVSSDSALRIDRRRDSWSLSNLDLDVTAGEGETLVIASTMPPVGLGKQMLTGSSADHHDEQLVVLIKVARIPSMADRM